MATQDRRVQHSRMKMTDTPSKKTEDYKDTVFLPVTAFPMKAGLAQKEPAMAERWAKIGIYDRLREQRKGQERFILNEGSPYANGAIHMCHAMNKVLMEDRKCVVSGKSGIRGEDVGGGRNIQ